MLRYLRRFTRLDVERRARVLRRLETHRIEAIRVGFWALRTLAFLGYYGRPEVGERIGYRPDPGGWEAWR